MATLDGADYSYFDSLPLVVRDGEQDYTIIKQHDEKKKLRIKVILSEDSAINFHYTTNTSQFMTLNLVGSENDFGSAVGLLGTF